MCVERVEKKRENYDVGVYIDMLILSKLRNLSFFVDSQ